MTNSVKASKTFQRDAKDLSKKFHTLKDSFNKLIADLVENLYLGDPYGNKLYKVRLADKSKGSGKSGGFRVIYYHLKQTEEGIEILLMTIFDKSDKSTITKDEALKMLSKILDEI